MTSNKNFPIISKGPQISLCFFNNRFDLVEQMTRDEIIKIPVTPIFRTIEQEFQKLVKKLFKNAFIKLLPTLFQDNELKDQKYFRKPVLKNTDSLYRVFAHFIYGTTRYWYKGLYARINFKLLQSQSHVYCSQVKIRGFS